MPLLEGGSTLYGHAFGVLMLDTRFPRPKGDVGNATTWPFPVRHKIVRGAEPYRVIGETEQELLKPFIDAARELVDEGVRAITTSCGFLAIFQRELADAVPVPVLTSSLLQVPTAAAMIGSERRVAILTGRDELSERHFNGVGWSSDKIPVVVKAFDPDSTFANVYSPRITEVVRPEADQSVLERELVDLANELVTERPDVGAIVMECTNFVPYSQAVRRATGLPVFDLYTLVVQAYEVTTGTEFTR
jgi:Asp/Glu/hydantoin racemase